MTEALDAALLRRWCQAGLAGLGVAREEIDALNVFPVPDGDTGTNLFLTMEAVVDAVDAVDVAAGVAGADLAVTARAMARGALLGARGNSGVILSQWLHGVAEVLCERPFARADSVRRALETAATQAYAAVAEPVEGTVLSVARSAAQGAHTVVADDLEAVVCAAALEAAAGLARTTEQLPTLQRAGVVDAGGRGLLVLLDSLQSVVTGSVVERRAPAGRRDLPLDEPMSGPAYEVMYLLEAADDAIADLRKQLGGLGDSLLVVGGDGLWNVHVHVDDAGAAVEAGVAVGRPHRIQVTHFGEQRRRGSAAGPEPGRRVVCVAPGPGIAALVDTAGAVCVAGGPGHRPSTADLLTAIRVAGTVEIVVLPNDPDSHAVAETAAHQAREGGLRVAVLPTTAPVQGLAALAVHDPGRRFDDDVVAMTAAAGATRHGELTLAVREAMTMAGVCQVGDVLGLLDGDIAVIGTDLVQVGIEVVDRMLGGGGELVTLVAGESAPTGLADRVAGHVQRSRPEVEVVVYEGGQPTYPLLVGVE
jgi:uncharacterized protein